MGNCNSGPETQSSGSSGCAASTKEMENPGKRKSAGQGAVCTLCIPNGLWDEASAKNGTA